MSDPAITAAVLRNKQPELLQNVAVWTIHHHLQGDLGLPSRRAAKKPLLKEAMKKRLTFCKKYQDCTSEKGKAAMFSDKSALSVASGDSMAVHRPGAASRYDPKFTVESAKPLRMMSWGAFGGNKGGGGLYFLPKNVTIKGRCYINVLENIFFYILEYS